MRRLLCIIALALGAGAAPARAVLRPPDAAATHRYLLARIALKRDEAREGPPALAAWHALATRLEGECPNILAGTPLAGPKPDTDLPGEYADGKLEFELGIAVLAVPELLERPLDTSFYAVVKRLRWSNRALTRLLHALALQSLRQSEVPTPDLCGDLRYWVASGYLRISPATERYDLELEGIFVMAPISLVEGEPKGLSFEARVAYRLRRYEAPADRRLAHRAFPLTSLLTTPRAQAYSEGPYFEAVKGVLSALGRKTP